MAANTTHCGTSRVPITHGASPILQVRRLGLNYSTGSRILGGRRLYRAVDDVSFEIGPGQTFAIVGESGSGKTSIVRSILRLIRPSQGQIRFQGRDIAGFRRHDLQDYRRVVRLVVQNPGAALNPRHTVGRLIGRALVLAKAGRPVVARETDRMMEAVGLAPGFAWRRPGELSGGERQRVALAAAFQGNPALVLLDEPTSALDLSVQAQILRLIVELQSQTGAAILLVSHNLAVVRQLADEVMVMQSGRVVEAGRIDAVINEPASVYARSLISAATHVEPSGHQFVRDGAAPLPEIL